jgi:hypothetical protein
LNIKASLPQNACGQVAKQLAYFLFPSEAILGSRHIPRCDSEAKKLSSPFFLEAFLRNQHIPRFVFFITYNAF